LEKGFSKNQASERKLFEDRYSEQTDLSNHALQDQAKTLQKIAEEQHQNDHLQIKRLGDELHERETSSDTSLVSPAAETAIRKQISGQYQKTADADMERRARENE